ncbi:MAG: rod shape-determining protein [Candidatus Magasanikbacteria bacterium CG_4_10_14_0_2_um_filter_33_14]|uniref:Cell shape-determining protein MreB n=1 Tax=Candidatus Magasanikbacteria bacterium CG_4_10_14_0_2_um_filter_33_14 TaxID=1974636 RepID=A0A2M7VA05_9BACT|nr:MAG: rod shape-determining protein [Candidatus Magasanikbacteria bacterium CG_4_10_14_0_2_um_filter_33_14]
MFNNFFRKIGKDIAIDLGTANTLVYTPDKGIVIDEPSVVAINTKTEQILAVGQEAKQMLGKTPAHIQVTKPLTAGVISDYEVTEKMLKYFIDKVQKDGFSLSSRPRVVIAVPLDVTEVEIKAVEDAVTSAGAREAIVVQGPMAAAIGARLPIQEAIGNMVVDIGAGNTEIAVLSLNGVVTWKSTQIAGDELNRNITQYAREVFNLLVGESHAEQIKLKVGSALPGNEPIEFTMKGRDVVTGLPKEILVSDGQIREAIARSVKTIVDHIKMTLETTPPELIADIHERGLLLVGGGSLLRGIDKVISRATEIAVRIADDPLTTTVRGAGILLEEDELLNLVALPSSKHTK